MIDIFVIIVSTVYGIVGSVIATYIVRGIDSLKNKHKNNR